MDYIILMSSWRVDLVNCTNTGRALGEPELDMHAHNGFLNFVHCDLIVGSFGELSTK